MTSGKLKVAKEIVWLLLLGVVLGTGVWACYDVVQVVFGKEGFLVRGLILGAGFLFGLFWFLPFVVDLLYAKNDQEAK